VRAVQTPTRADYGGERATNKLPNSTSRNVSSIACQTPPDQPANNRKVININITSFLTVI
jgi:hypothetical protein